MTTFTVIGAGTASTGSGSVTPGVHASTASGDLILACIAAAPGSQTISHSGSYTLVKQGSLNSFVIYGKIAGGSETGETWTFSASGAHAAFTVTIRSSDGWPAIGSALVDSAVGHNGSGATGQKYVALTVTSENLCGIQFAGKNTTTGGATAVAVTSGYTAAGTAFNNSGGGGITLSAQMFNGSPTIMSGMPVNLVAITGNTESTTTNRGISLSLAPAAVAFTYDASSRIDSPYNALPEIPANIGLLSGYEAGDTFEWDDAHGSIPSGVTLGDNGYLDITTAAFVAAGGTVTIYIKLRDANGDGDGIITYALAFAQPVNAIRGGGDWGWETGGAGLTSLQNIRGGGNWGWVGGGFLTLIGGRNVPFDGYLTDPAIVPVWFVDLAFDSGHVYLHTDLGTITTLGHDWLGVGTLGSIGEIEETDDGSPTATSLTLSGLDQNLLESALTEAYFDRFVTIYLGVRDTVTGALATTPMQIAVRRMDDMQVASGSQASTITLHTESEMISMKRSLVRYFSDSQLQSEHPGALGFRYLASMVNARITIGSKQTITFGVDSKFQQ